ncbi:MAG: Ig-like domain-containing protein [Gemmatimonas sp.]
MPTTPSRPEVPRTVVRFGQAVAGIAGRSRRFAAALAWLTMVGSACNSADPVRPAAASQVQGAFLGNGTVGMLLDQSVRFLIVDDDGNPETNVAVNWTPSGNGRVSSTDGVTDQNGIVEIRWTLGTVSGMQTVTARGSDGSEQVYFANASPDRAATVTLATNTAQMLILGDTVHVRAFVSDRYGNVVSNEPTFTIESGAAAIAIVSTGAFVARARGTARVRVQSDTAKAFLTIAVTPGAPVVDHVLPDTLSPGANITISGNYFALAPEFIEVTVGGVHAAINKVSENTIEATIPSGSAFGCAPTAPQSVRVTIAGNSGQFLAQFRTANRIKLARGESANLLDIQQVTCTELVEPSSPQRAKYVVAVLNTSVTAATFSGFELRATGGGLMANQVASAKIEASSIAVPGSQQNRAEVAFQQVLAEEKGHADFLERQRATFAQYGSPVPAWNRIRAERARFAAVRVAPAVGDLVTMKAIYTSCSVGRDVRARVVYVGSKSVILEDVLSPRAGQMDAQYKSMGMEFDDVEYPLLRTNMGDPLAMDATLGGDGRVTMLFTRYVNDSLPGIQGYATACNFYPKATFAPSNEDEVFYARVASASEDPEAWRRSMRSTLLHESKHLASFAERISHNLPFEESWLEESTARIAEELYSRTFAGGGSWKGNSGYTSTVRCEIYQCDDRPLMMWKHFSVLHQFFRGVDTLTPIGAAASGDFTFYASGWSLVRWAADHYAINESEWLRDLVRGGAQTGLANLALRSGHPVDEMLADWSLANAVDDQSAFIAVKPTLSFPSWNMPDIMNGLASADPSRFGDATPLKIRAFSFGSTSLLVPKLRAFSSSYFSFEGQQIGSQLVELRGENGGILPTSLRVAIVRVE